MPQMYPLPIMVLYMFMMSMLLLMMTNMYFMKKTSLNSPPLNIYSSTPIFKW